MLAVPMSTYLKKFIIVIQRIYTGCGIFYVF